MTARFSYDGRASTVYIPWTGILRHPLNSIKLVLSAYRLSRVPENVAVASLHRAAVEQGLQVIETPGEMRIQK